MKRFLTLILALFCAIGCNDGVELPESKPQIVVEGWIEDNGFPIVILTTTVPASETMTDISDLKEHVINWGKVTISDGEEEVVLIGQKNDDYFPPYIYTTSALRGKAGKEYTIKVEYSDRTVTASTTIPEPKELEYIKVAKAESKLDLFYIVGGLKDNPQTKDYYKVFTKVYGKDSTYVSSFMGLTDDSILGPGTEEIAINNGTGRIDEQITAYFTADDIVSIRFCTLDNASWMYWSDFEELQSLSSSPIFPVNTIIRSNIKGGLGYWAGYGSTYYKVSIPDSLKNGRIKGL